MRARQFQWQLSSWERILARDSRGHVPAENEVPSRSKSPDATNREELKAHTAACHPKHHSHIVRTMNTQHTSERGPDRGEWLLGYSSQISGPSALLAGVKPNGPTATVLFWKKKMNVFYSIIENKR